MGRSPVTGTQKISDFKHEREADNGDVKCCYKHLRRLINNIYLNDKILQMFVFFHIRQGSRTQSLPRT